MLIPQQAQAGTYARQGSRRVGFDELRRQLADPSGLSDGQRQRLLDLDRRLARIKALGDDFHRISFSPQAQAVLDSQAVSA